MATSLATWPCCSAKEALVNTTIERLTAEKAARIDSDGNDYDHDDHDDHNNNKEDREWGWVGATVPR